MPEIHPDDATLLALSEDAATGVPYIATGASPYFLQFRQMLHRLLRATERANDLRVYPAGELTLGVRPGRATIGDTTVDFPGVESVGVPPSTIREVYLDAQARVRIADTLPPDRDSYIPLARVTTGPSAITSLVDRRGEVMLQSPSPSALGLSATAEEIDRALDGAGERVTAQALNRVCGGSDSIADLDHRHFYFTDNYAGESPLSLFNLSDDDQASVGFRLGLPSRGAIDLRLARLDAGYVTQGLDGGTDYQLLGVLPITDARPGPLTADVAGRLIGPVPIGGVVETITLSVGVNTESDDDGDGVTARVKVNGSAIASTDPGLTAAAGPGFRSTAQGQGVAAVIDPALAGVRRGDLMSVDLTRTAHGSVSVDPADVAVVVTIRAATPM